ncbi:MAG: hypothetical protein JKY37_15390 [Nannocystaceae bacterium]|nr:hypothetical protein [Nannocystaceae bacterium]
MADLWRTRLIWAGIGAAAAVAAIRFGTPALVASSVAPVADAAVASAAMDEPAVATQSGPAPADDLPATPVPRRAEQTGDVEAGVASKPVRHTKADKPSKAVQHSPPDKAAPEYPFPRMPGMTKLRSSQRFDDKQGRWIITRASRVPAPMSVVESFYTRALRDAGMTVRRIDEPTDADGTRRLTLKARGKSGRAQIAIRQPAGELTTTARVIWQPGG